MDERIRVRIEVREWAEFDVGSEWFAGEIDDDPDELWKAVVALYTDQDPGLAWESTEGGSNRVTVTRLGTDEAATTAYINPEFPEPS